MADTIYNASFSSESENATEEYLNDGEYIVSKYAVITYFGILAFGSLINTTICIGLLAHKRNGVLSLVLQLSFVDALSIYVAAFEIWSLKQKSWCFSSELCQLFSGSEVLTNTLVIYLIISFNFHIISLINVNISEQLKNNKNPLTSCNEDDSNECLVKKADNQSNRNVTIDYRKRKNEVSVIFPSMLVWFTCLSLSIPEYTLASTVKLPNNYTLCAIVDGYYGQLLQKLLLVFRVIIPEPLLAISLFILLIKLYLMRTRKNKVESIILKNLKDAESLLVFATVLTLLYLLTSSQRDVFYFQHIVTQKDTNDTIEYFKAPPFHNNFVSNYSITLLSMFHYSSTLLRPLLYSILLPAFRNLLKQNLFTCCQHSEDTVS